MGSSTQTKFIERDKVQQNADFSEAWPHMCNTQLDFNGMLDDEEALDNIEQLILLPKLRTREEKQKRVIISRIKSKEPNVYLLFDELDEFEFEEKSLKNL